ncbi:MAG: hypothetical protein KIT43_01930 [Bauldia sp.]|nr:hypothetical protein [Bauldia sp.]
MSRHHCWNCDYRLEGDPSRCPRCGMPLAGLDAPRQPAAASAAGAGPARTKSRRSKADARPEPKSQPQPKAGLIPPGEPPHSATARIAAGAGKGLRLAATGAGRGLLASLGVARKSVATGAALSVKTARLVGSAAGGVASGVRAGGTRLIAYRPQRPARALDGDILHRENVRTIADVAERLLRETREENARLAARIAALEARFAADRISATPSASTRKKASAPSAPAAGSRKPKPAGASRSTASRTAQSPPREPMAAPRPVITLEARAEPAKAAVPSRASETAKTAHSKAAASAKPAAPAKTTGSATEPTSARSTSARTATRRRSAQSAG